MKYKYYEDKKRVEYLDRISKIFQVNKKTAENIVSIGKTASIRLNTLSNRNSKDILEELKNLEVQYSAIPWCENGYYLYSDKKIISSSCLLQNGSVYLQNASSFVPALVLDVQPGDSILDMCAAPGGKSTHIAAITNNQCSLWLNDVSYPRVKTMEKILQNYDVAYDSLTIHPSEELPNYIEQRFDKILLDAQCSGEGMLELSHPRALQYWSIARINKFHSLQLKMIESAYKLLKPGGTLVYSTCTFAPEENEIIVDSLLSKHSDMSVEQIQLPIETRIPALTFWQGRELDPTINRALRIIPTQFMEGFFVCKLKKSLNVGAND